MSRRWVRGIVILGVVAVSSLFAVLRADEGERQKEGTEGIAGRVLKMSGNFMPGDGRDRGVCQPLAVPVHVFQSKVKVFQEPAPKHPQLVKIVNSDKEGNYRCALPPGEYTVVAVIDKRLYLNIQTFDGKHAYWATVTVKAEQWATMNIEDTSSAAF